MGTDMIVMVTGFVGTVLGWALKSYAEEKGKNLATREDIAAITREVEGVKAEFERDRAARRAEHEAAMKAYELKHQLVVAALPERLRVHQEAHKLWSELLDAIGDEENIGPTIMKCQGWWMSNNLYLTPEARQAFRLAYHQAHLRHEMMRFARNGARPDTETMKSVYDDIMKVGPILAQATSLPSLGDDELLPPTVLATPETPARENGAAMRKHGLQMGGEPK